MQPAEIPTLPRAVRQLIESLMTMRLVPPDRDPAPILPRWTHLLLGYGPQDVQVGLWVLQHRGMSSWPTDAQVLDAVHEAAMLRPDSPQHVEARRELWATTEGSPSYQEVARHGLAQHRVKVARAVA